MVVQVTRDLQQGVGVKAACQQQGSNCTCNLVPVVQGKIQGFGSDNSGGHFGGLSSSNSGQYGGIGSHGSSSFSAHSSRAGGMGSGIPTSFAEAQRAASQFTQVSKAFVLPQDTQLPAPLQKDT